MNLKEFYGKNVVITSINNKVFNGIVDDYFYPEDNDNGKESIVVTTEDGTPREFYEENITKIMIIN